MPIEKVMRKTVGSSAAVWRTVGAFFLRFLICSIVLYSIFYLFAEKHYVRIIALIAKPVLSALGYEIVIEKTMKIAEDISLNPLVFVSLSIAVAGIPWKARLRGTLIGILILFAANAVTVSLVFIAAYRQSEGWWTGAEVLNLTNNFFVPILLWLVLLPIRSAFPFFSRLSPNASSSREEV